MKIAKKSVIILMENKWNEDAGGHMDFEEAQEHIGQRVRRERKRTGLSQEELANKSKVGVKVIYKIENYRGNPTLKTIGKLAKFFGLGIEDICPAKKETH